MKTPAVLFCAALLLFFLLSVLAWRAHVNNVCPHLSQKQLRVGDKIYAVGVARTAAEQVRGLGGCTYLAPLSGLYFPFAPGSNVTFWMKDMLMPIDIIWIAQGRVIGLEGSVPPPSPGQAELPRYVPPGPVDAVLEIGAGQAAAQGIAIGTPVLD
jgi:uncharacterized membrane protein (UPF0127 family)